MGTTIRRREFLKSAAGITAGAAGLFAAPRIVTEATGCSARKAHPPRSSAVIPGVGVTLAPAPSVTPSARS